MIGDWRVNGAVAPMLPHRDLLAQICPSWVVVGLCVGLTIVYRRLVLLAHGRCHPWMPCCAALQWDITYVFVSA